MRETFEKRRSRYSAVRAARRPGRFPGPDRAGRWCLLPAMPLASAAARRSRCALGPERARSGACHRNWSSGWTTPRRARWAGAEQNDVVELRMELPLIRGGSADEQHVGVVRYEETV